MSLVPAAFLPESRIFAGAIVFLASYPVFALGKFPGLKIERAGRLLSARSVGLPIAIATLLCGALWPAYVP